MIQELLKIRETLDDERLQLILALARYVQNGFENEEPVNAMVVEELDLFNKAIEDVCQQLHDVDIEIDKLDHTKEECQHEAFTSFGAPQVCKHCRLGL